MSQSYDDFKVGDQVHCLAWLGKVFTVSAKDDDTGRIALQGPSATDPYGAQLDIFPATMWMITHQPWDQIWAWPDRAGERSNQVFERFSARHTEGEVVQGYYNDDGLQFSSATTYLAPKPKLAMNFRIRTIDIPGGEIRVEPVARLGEEEWTTVGPNCGLRVGMRAYRWALSFGELILNWEDFLRPE